MPDDHFSLSPAFIWAMPERKHSFKAEIIPAVYRLSSFHHHAIAARTCAATEQNVYAIVGLTSARQLDSGYVSGGQ